MHTTGILPRLMAGLALLALMAGCQPARTDSPEVSVEAVRHTLNSWNPSFAKVMEFYGLYFPEGPAAATTGVAYVLLTNPADKEQKLVIYEAQLRKLLRPDGQMQWYVTGLVSHSAGLTRRQGWDTLLIPVKAPEGNQGR